MKRLLSFCALVALVALTAATPSFVRLPVPVLIPSSYPTVGANIISGWGSALTTLTDSHRAGFIFKVPPRGNTPDTITLLGAYVRTVSITPTGDTSVTCTLYNVKAGYPEVAPSVPAVLYHAGTTAPHGGTAPTYSDNKMIYVAFTTAPVCTAGQTIAAVFRRTAGSNNSISIYDYFTSLNATTQAFPFVVRKTASNSWSRIAAVPAYGLKYADFESANRYLDAGMPVDSINTLVIDSASGTDETGNRMLFPFPMKVIGAWGVLILASGPPYIEMALYDTTGTNGTKIAGATMSDSFLPPASAETGTRYVYFGGEITLNANQTYRLVYHPIDSVGYATTYRYVFLDSTSKMYGPRITRTSRANDGAWVDQPNAVTPHMGLIVSQLSAGSEDAAAGQGRLRRIQIGENGKVIEEDIGPWVLNKKASVR